MDHQNLIAIDIHTHAEVSCRNPFDNYGEEYDRAADKYFGSNRRPTIAETVAYYRERKIGLVMFTVDSEAQLGRRRIPNEEIADAARGIDNDAKISMLLFRAGSPEPKAVPLSLVTRLEEFEIEKIEHSNGRDLVQYRGSLMPLVYPNYEVRRREEGTQPMLVFSDAGRSMGLVVDEIVDIVEESLNIQVGSDVPGVLGSAVIKGKATEILDIGHYLPLAFEDWFKRKEISSAALTRKLLFIDDSAFFRNMLGPVMKAAGFDVTVCSSAT